MIFMSSFIYNLLLSSSMSSLSFSCENNINHYGHKIKCFSRLRGWMKDTGSIINNQILSLQANLNSE